MSISPLNELAYIFVELHCSNLYLMGVTISEYLLIWPIVAHHPKCRPAATHATRHMFQVDDKQPFIVDLLTRESNAFTARSYRILIVHAEVNLIRCGYKSTTLSRRAANIID